MTRIAPEGRSVIGAVAIGCGVLAVLGVIDKMERLSSEDLHDKLKPYFNDAVEDFLASVELLRSQRDLDGLQRVMESLAPTGEIKQAVLARIDEWRALLESLEAYGVSDYLQIDLGIVRGLAY